MTTDHSQRHLTNNLTRFFVHSLMAIEPLGSDKSAGGRILKEAHYGLPQVPGGRLCRVRGDKRVRPKVAAAIKTCLLHGEHSTPTSVGALGVS